jgi:hypothetical protein
MQADGFICVGDIPSDQRTRNGIPSCSVPDTSGRELETVTTTQAETADLERAAPIDLQRWTSSRILRNGVKVCIRPLRSDDREREVE